MFKFSKLDLDNVSRMAKLDDGMVVAYDEAISIKSGLTAQDGLRYIGDGFVYSINDVILEVKGDKCRFYLHH